MASVNNTAVGAIRVDASLESGKFVDGAKKIRKETQQTEAVVKSSFSSMGAAVKGFGGAMTAGLSIGLLGGLAKKALDFAAAIGTTAKQLGVTTKELQEFRYAADTVGIKQAEADKGLEKFNLTLGKAAQGSAAAQKALGAVGVTLADVQSKSKAEIFGQIADQMLKQGGAAKNAAAGNVIFGESFGKLVPLLDQGSAGINQLSEAANRLGIVLSDEQIQKADETAQKLDDVKQVLQAQIAGVVADNAQSIVSLANALASLTSSIVQFMGSNPQAALAIIGGLAGSRFGVPGAIAGASAGFLLGGKVARDAADGNMDRKFRATEIRKALANYRSAKSGASDPTGKLGANPAAVAAARQELERQVALGLKANAARPRSSTGGAPLPPFLAPTPKAPRTRRARTARTPKGPADRSDDTLFQFAEEQRRADMDILRAKQSLARDTVERTNIAIQMLDLEKESVDAEIANRVRRAERDFAEGKITAAALEQAKVQAEGLKAKNDEVDALKRRAVIEEEQQRAFEDSARLDAVSLDIEREKLQADLQLAETSKKQRDIQLRILKISYEIERQRLLTVLADKESSDAAKEEARRRLAALDALESRDREAVIRSTRGPLEDLAGQLPTDADKLNEALEGVAANGLKALEDGLVDVIQGTKSVKEAFHDMASQILAELIRIAIQKYIIGTIMKVAGIGAADGGQVSGFAYGGFVSGPGGPREDKVPAMLSNGEFVINAKATNKFLPLLEAINSGKIPGMSIGGMAGLSIPRASYGERAAISNDNTHMPKMELTFHNDFRGADPSSVAAIQARQDRMEAELPARVVAAYRNAKDRFVIRD